jgi:hypothetical protein
VREEHKEIASNGPTTLMSEESKLRGICASGIKRSSSFDGRCSEEGRGVDNTKIFQKLGRD